MSSREEKHLNRHRLCYKCDSLVDKEEELNMLTVSGRGYGSSFDSCSIWVQLCNDCMKAEYAGWFHETPQVEECVERYHHEESIRDLVNGFILENREYVWNGMSGYQMERQDWIDMENGILPDEKYEEYGMYSPRQIEAYEQRFSTCEHPINITYSDDSKGCGCAFGAFGMYGQMPSRNICDECFGCSHFETRTTPLKEMTSVEFKEYKSYLIGKMNYEKYKDKFETN